MTRQGSVGPLPRRGRIRHGFWSNQLYPEAFEMPSNKSAGVPVTH